jgi:hypothetical protein
MVVLIDLVSEVLDPDSQVYPEQWPRKLIIYVILLQLGSISLNGYGFLISQEVGLLVLVTYFISLFAFAFYQYKFKRLKGRTNS